MKAVLCAALLLLAAGARAETVFRYAPSSDLSSLDSQITTATTVGQHGLMVYDTLYALDGHLLPQPQMVERAEISVDGLTRRYILRAGLRFHDGQKVTGADVTASLRRWGTRDTLGQQLLAATASLSAEPDAITLVLKRPFPFVELAFASTGGTQAVIYRREDAEKDAFKPITTTVGSGPFRFLPERYIAGVGAAWARNPDYLPRPEPADGLAGGKVVHVDRVELKFLPDASTRAAALRKGEIDFIDQMPADLLPVLQRDPNVVVGRFSPLGSLAFIRPNHLFPPFDNVKARQALALLVDQADYMSGYGTPEWWQPCYAWFVCGGPNGTDAGSEPYRQKNVEAARRLMAEAGYKGERIVVVGSQELPAQGMMADVLVASLGSIGMNVDYQQMDFATLVARRFSKNRPEQGGWNVAVSAINGVTLSQPATNFVVDTECSGKTYFGWPCDERAQRLRAEYMEATDPAQQRAKLEALSRALWESLPAILVGQYYSPFGWRREIKGMLRTANVVFWNLEKTQ
jgi:peptide/nickel transport system substrate-binding protein